MSMKKTFVGFAIVGLFVVTFLGFLIETQESNGLNETLRDNYILNKTYVDLSDEIGGFQDTAEGQSNVQDDDNPLTEGGSLLFVSITKTGKVLKGMITGVYNVIVRIPANLLGIPEIVVITITSIITVLLILGAWRLYKAGE